MGAAFHVRPAGATTLKPIAPTDPRVSAVARANAARISQQRLDAWRSFPHVISKGNVDWSPESHRRLDRQPSNALKQTFRSAVSRGKAVTAGPPEVINVAFFRVDFLADREGDASTG